MRLKTLYVRFYRSFNYDYLRKVHPRAAPHPWDTVNDLFFPFVRVPLEVNISTIVGANESGKSQLLNAIECLLTGDNIEPKDFCRYSQFFTVGEKMALPEFGGEFADLDDQQREAVAQLMGIEDGSDVDSIYLFRTNTGVTLYVEVEPEDPSQPEPGGTWAQANLGDGAIEGLRLPTSFRIDARVPLPDSVPLAYLAVEEKEMPLRPRSNVLTWLQDFLKNEEYFSDAQTLEGAKAELVESHVVG